MRTHVLAIAVIGLITNVYADHMCTSATPGTLVAAGDSPQGQTNCPPGSNYVAIASHYRHSLALRSDGTIVGWGYNLYGQTNCPPGSNYIAIAAGNYHSLALRNDGTLVGWGDNAYGQTNCPAGSNYVAIAAGNHHSLALRSNGTLVGWGENNHGQITCPAGSNYIAIAAGNDHSIGLCGNGALVAWGDNGYNQTNALAGSNYVAIAGGYFHSLALSNNGTLAGWSNNDYGQLNFPAGSNYIAIVASYLCSLALRSDGTLAGWGTSVPVLPAGSNYLALAAGYYHTVAIRFYPVIDITNAARAVDVATPSAAIGGTNAPWTRAIGSMWWTNTTNGAQGSFAASASWAISNIPLVRGHNLIDVYGSNAVGEVGVDSTVITRGEVMLEAPPDGQVTNVLSLSLQAFFGSAIPYRYLMTNTTPVFNPADAFSYTNIVSFPSTGRFYWSALGYDAAYTPHYAWQTNQITIVGAQVRLLSPPQGTVLTNSLACRLVADYGCADRRQLSTNNGASWFDYDPLGPVVFPGAGTYSWTARGSTGGAWWYASKTNALLILTNWVSGTLLLATPAQGMLSTSTSMPFNAVVYGPGFLFTEMAIDTGTFSLASFPATNTVAPGVHTWTARGGTLPGPVYTYAPATNTFTVVDPGTSSVTLVAPSDRAVLEQDYVYFDVLFCNIGRPELSTNRGISWFAYHSPIAMVTGEYEWTARGTNRSGTVLYTPATNMLFLMVPEPAAVALLLLWYSLFQIRRTRAEA